MGNLSQAVKNNWIEIAIGMGMFYMLKGQAWKAAGVGIAAVATVKTARQATGI